MEEASPLVEESKFEQESATGHELHLKKHLMEQHEEAEEPLQQAQAQPWPIQQQSHLVFQVAPSGLLLPSRPRTVANPRA